MWGPRKQQNTPVLERGGPSTYTSVVMNPVSSDRKRKRMKRQQQMETRGENRVVRRSG